MGEPLYSLNFVMYTATYRPICVLLSLVMYSIMFCVVCLSSLSVYCTKSVDCCEQPQLDRSSLQEEPAYQCLRVELSDPPIDQCPSVSEFDYVDIL